MRDEHRGVFHPADLRKPTKGWSLNKRLASWITTKIGTMACAYVFTMLALVSLPGALHTGSSVVIVSWVAQTFLQLVLLPVIMVGQSIQAELLELKNEADHYTWVHIATQQDSINAKVESIIEMLRERSG